MARIYVCGEAIVDFVQVTSEDGPAFRPLPGGSPFNITKAAAQAGSDASFLGAVSTDLFGAQLMADLEAHGVDTTLTPRSDDPSTLAFVDTSSGEPEYAFFDRQSVSANMAPDARTVLEGPGDILTIGSISLIPQPAADNITRFAQDLYGRMMIAMDPNVRANMIHDRPDWEKRIETLFDLCTIVKISSEDLAYLRPGQDKREFAHSLLECGVALVVITGGAEGAVGLTANAECDAHAPRVQLVDTVGAGDTFMGNLLAGLQRENCKSAADIAALPQAKLTSVLEKAGWAAAINCTRKGCQPPLRSETEEFMALGKI